MGNLLHLAVNCERVGRADLHDNLVRTVREIEVWIWNRVGFRIGHWTRSRVNSRLANPIPRNPLVPPAHGNEVVALLLARGVVVRAGGGVGIVLTVKRGTGRGVS